MDYVDEEILEDDLGEDETIEYIGKSEEISTEKCLEYNSYAKSSYYFDDERACNPTQVTISLDGRKFAQQIKLMNDEQNNDNFQWNKQFQNIYENYYQLRGAIGKLISNFTKEVKEIGQQIISEKHLKLEDKTIKPLAGVGENFGVAGGEKYIHHGIFFKYALDISNIYGGDQNAMKVASHELKATNLLFEMSLKNGILIPLIALIDFRGYRISGSAILPINSETIQFGSNDAGKTIHFNLQENIKKKYFQICKKINLKSHQVKSKSTKEIFTIIGPIDLEIHKGKDEKYYLVDLSRLIPPQPSNKYLKFYFPEIKISCENPLKTEYLFKLMRPELLLSSEVPLCSDAFSPFLHDGQASNDEVIKVWCKLIREIIPNTISRLIDYKIRSKAFLSEINLIDEIHHDGINCRLIGYICDFIIDKFNIQFQLGNYFLPLSDPFNAPSSPYPSSPLPILGSPTPTPPLPSPLSDDKKNPHFFILSLFATEIILRSFKNLLRAKMRSLISTNTNDFLSLFTHHFNQLICFDSTTTIWDDIFKHIQIYFPNFHLSNKEILLNLIHKQYFFGKIFLIFGVHVSQEWLSAHSSNQSIPLSIKHILSCKSTIKCLSSWIYPENNSLPSCSASDTDDFIHPAFPKSSISSQKCEIKMEEFKIVRVLMEGFTSQVYLIEWKSRILVLSCYRNSLHYKKFSAAVEELVKLDHPNLIKVYGKCSSKSGSITEYMPGGTLGDFCEKLSQSDFPNQFDWSILLQILSIIKSIAEGMNYLHSQCPPWIHGNLTVANVFFSESEQVKLNVSILSREIDLPATALNDPNFLEITEVKEGLPFTEKTDVYYFGYLFWLLLTPTSFYIASDPFCQFWCNNFSSNIPLPIVSLIRECTAKNPKDRPDFYQILELLNNLSEVLRTEMEGSIQRSSNKL